MEDFVRLFGNLLALEYHCFGRVVISGHLPLLTRPENLVHFFRDVHGVKAMTKEVLKQRTIDYHQWVESFALNHQLPLEWAEKGVRKEDYVRPWLRRMEQTDRFGVYFILKSMEVGSNFRSAMPRYPVADPDYRILSRQRSRFTDYYFYIATRCRDRSRCVWAFSCLCNHLLPQRPSLHRTAAAPRWEFRKDDNAYLWVTDPRTLQAAADALSAKLIRTRLIVEVLQQGPPGHLPRPLLLH